MITLNGTPNNVTMSNGNLTMTRNSTAIGGVASTSFDGPAVGNLGVKYYFEVTLLTSLSNGNSIGFVTPSGSVTNNPSVSGGAADKTGVSLGSANSIVYLPNGINTGIDIGPAAVNDVIGVSIDMDNSLVWFRRNTGNWNNSGSANPATGAGGVQYILRAGYAPYGAFAAGSNATDVMKFNFGQTTFGGTPPSGFGSGSGGGATGGSDGWFEFKLTTTVTPQVPGYIHVRVRAAKPSTTYYIDPKVVLGSPAPPPSNTTFDGATTFETTLTNGNLTATRTTYNVSLYGGAHSVSYQSSGKYYFEVTVGPVVNASQNAIGIILTGATYQDAISGTNSTIVYRNSAIYSNNAAQGKFISNITANLVFCVAVDLTARLAWIRTGAGNWNGSGSADPATGVGGVPVASGSFAPYIGLGAGSLNDSMTANFGQSAFTGAVPSGFTSGWPA